MPQPRVEFNWDKLDALMQFKVTKQFVAAYLGVSEDTVDRRIREKYDMTFTEYGRLRMQRTAVKLQQKAIEMALTGKNNSVMIFALKNLANWTDKIEQEVTGGSINIKIDSQDKEL